MTREEAEKLLMQETGLSLRDLPDELPIEEFFDEDGNFDYDAISAWRKEGEMKLYHVTTIKKAKLYRQTGHIIKPVRGFTTLQGAMAWAMKIGRKIIYEINEEDKNCYKLPDHHNQFGEAWWVDANIKNFKCVFSADNDA